MVWEMLGGVTNVADRASFGVLTQMFAPGLVDTVNAEGRRGVGAAAGLAGPVDAVPGVGVVAVAQPVL